MSGKKVGGGLLMFIGVGWVILFFASQSGASGTEPDIFMIILGAALAVVGWNLYNKG